MIIKLLISISILYTSNFIHFNKILLLKINIYFYLNKINILIKKYVIKQ